ncbi:avidin-like [Erythrolamprus reginae]|uniref:avidin-like n=1 Tax=Erythrolamprus reginae TaxID=121349 RepID=UPI00396C7458
MATGTGALLGLLLAFLLGSSGTSVEARNSERFAARQCVLSGNWTNDLNSTMQINGVNMAGVFSGTYLTVFSNTSTPFLPSPLQGFQQLTDQLLFGFTVNWTFSASTTVFVGQCFVDGDGRQLLKTSWLERAAVQSMQGDWRATRVGTNTFHRTN